MLQLRGLSYAYPDRPSLDFPDWTVEAGQSALLAGPSGSGKSTLLMLIAGLLEPRRGGVWIDGQWLGDYRGAARDALRGRLIGIVLQSFCLLPHLTLLENLTLAQFLSGNRVDSDAARATLAALEIVQLADRRPRHLSRGELQRAAIARAVVNRPRLLLADEPTSSLDDAAAQAALDLLLQESHRLGATLLIATHDSRVKARIPLIWELVGQ
jgi:putative ABC transport system ATP-binding protein